MTTVTVQDRARRLGHKLTRSDIKKWADALRSGKYKQTRGSLYSWDESGRKVDGMCCIAVGAHVLRKFVVARSSTEQAAHAIGLEVGEQNELVDMNDSQKQDFVYIADWIEKNL